MSLEKALNLSHYLSTAGVASRRHAATLIKEGKIKVNREVCITPGYRVLPNDTITYQNQEIYIKERVYIMLNKPRGYVCTSSDPYATKKAIDLIPLKEYRLFSIGRLDKESEGLILFTNDGAYSETLMHPRYEIKKEYIVTTNKPLSPKMRQQCMSGIDSDGEHLHAISVTEEGDCCYRFVLNEGKKREIRRLIQAMGRQTKSLKRVSIGKLQLGDLKSGAWRHLTPKDIKLALEQY